MEWVTMEQPNPVYTLAREVFVQRVELLGLHKTTYGEAADGHAGVKALNFQGRQLSKRRTPSDVQRLHSNYP